MIVKNINSIGRIIRGALGVLFLGAAAQSSAGSLRMIVLLAVGALLIFQAAVSM